MVFTTYIGIEIEDVCSYRELVSKARREWEFRLYSESGSHLTPISSIGHAIIGKQEVQIHFQYIPEETGPEMKVYPINGSDLSLVVTELRSTLSEIEKIVISKN